jgi:SH3-like domain-containing protein
MSSLAHARIHRPASGVLLRVAVGCMIAASLWFTPSSVVHAAEFRSVGSAAAVLYDGPSAKGKKLFVAPRGMPLEVLSVVNNWVKVRDLAGDVLWIERSDLSNTRTLVAIGTVAVRSGPQDNATVVFQIERGVMLELTDAKPAPGWAKVKHPDGALGFVKASEVWGL